MYGSFPLTVAARTGIPAGRAEVSRSGDERFHPVPQLAEMVS
jgi:hypothetical protein